MKEIIKITKDLIKIKSTKDDLKSKQEAINYIKNYFNKNKFKIKKYNINNNPALFVCNKSEEKLDLLLNGHLDVVDGEDNQFEPLEKGGKIYGRGAGDMKAGCAVMVKFLKDFSDKNFKKSVGLLLTTDEEVGGANGVGYLMKNQLKNLKPKVVVVPDGGENLRTIILNQKGILQVKIEAKGISAHGARPFWGDNAIEKLLNIYEELKKKFPNPSERVWKNTMNLGRFYGGKAINKVPDKAEMFLDFRFIKKNDRENIIKKISQVTKDFKVLAEGDPFVQEKNELLSCYKKIVEEEIKKKVFFDKIEGASDARYFLKKESLVIVTKINCGNIHGDKEWVEIKEMEDFYNILNKFINEIE
jgi:succinyl-diaminopimelate desuccinylase